MSDFKLQWRGPAVSADTRAAGLEGLRDAGGLLLAASNERVPVDSGELKGSGAVAEEKGAVLVGYSADHSVIVHEDLGVAHPRGEAKFLEKALAAEQGALLGAVAARLQGVLKG